MKDCKIAILRTNWEEKYSGGRWPIGGILPFWIRTRPNGLVAKRFTAVGYGCAQEFVTRIDADDLRRHEAISFNIHTAFLKARMMSIEYLTNLSLIKKDRVQIFGLPMKIEECEGALARIVANGD